MIPACESRSMLEQSATKSIYKTEARISIAKLFKYFDIAVKAKLQLENYRANHCKHI